MKRIAKDAPTEKGQSLVEFGIGLFILIILLAGSVDAGRALVTYMALREAAQEGALFGSTNPTNNTLIEGRVRNSSDLLQSLGADADIDVQIIGSACTGNGIRVRVTFEDFLITMPYIGAVIGSQTVPISASATNTILRPPCP
jgi:Flp pilus assembly protein TadG